MKINRRIFCSYIAAGAVACTKSVSPSDGSSNIYEAYNKEFWNLILKEENFKVLGNGYGWSEGPAWDKSAKKLYFTDVPGNIAYQWTEQTGVEVFLNPSGSSNTEGFREAGANGLLYTGNDQLLICNHGERAVQSMEISTGKRTVLTDEFQGKKFNSPNDLVQSSKGDIFFTDPPYGLENLNKSPLKEIKANGVYRLKKNGKVKRIIKDMTFPNGIALSPDQATLYIAQSDPKAPHLYKLDLTKPKQSKTLMVDFSEYMGDEFPGLPDGMAVDVNGNIFATGPGGVFVISPSGNVLGRILTGKGSANCTFGEDGSTLFITNHDRLIKLKTQTLGL